ncbi:MAG: serine/threonine-protein kinase [Leptolyngbyaceae cyanobacterium MO_188.B28]|nr:serine/threonine-protein kinase [Leptolyngbyaceae cyanobacterium MO_188.B28]
MSFPSDDATVELTSGINHFVQFRRRFAQYRQRCMGLCQRHLLTGVWAIATATATVLDIGLVQLWERQTHTVFFELRGPVSPPENLLILAIDEESLSQGQHYVDNSAELSSLEPIKAWPWQRQAYAIVIEKLMAAGARSIALDIIFSTSSSYGDWDDQALAEVLQRYGDRVVLAAKYEDVVDTELGQLIQPTLPLPLFQETSVGMGSINLLIDPNGRIHQLGREFLEILKQSEQTLLGGVVEPSEQILSFAEAVVKSAQLPHPEAKGGDIFFHGPPQTFEHVPFWHVLDPDLWETRLRSGEYFEDKIVVIGSTAKLHQDFFAAPFSRSLLYPQPLAGVEIQANAIATLSSDQALMDLMPHAWLRGGMAIAVAVIVGGVLSRVRSPLFKLVGVGVGILGWFGLGYVCFVYGGMVAPTALPISVIALVGVSDFIRDIFRDQIKKKQLRSSLAQYAASPIVQAIISQQEDLQDLLKVRESEVSGNLLRDRYRIVKVLGAGGFGETYVAEDTQRPGNPPCVVKQLKIVSDNPLVLKVARRLFMAEAETLEKLGQHDQIPRLLAYFESNQKLYLVQEMVQGRPLNDELLLYRHLSPAKRAKLLKNWGQQILKDLLPVLEFIHSQKVIHRDIKPSNIIRRESDKRLVLIDFGAVKQLSNRLAGEEPKAQLTIGVGTKGYVPSEQLGGTPHFSSDLYALGMTVIEVLTGRRPKALNRSSTGEVLWMDLAPDLNPVLADILSKMVRSDFRQRYQSARAVLQDLKKLGGIEESEPPVSSNLDETAGGDFEQDLASPSNQPILSDPPTDETIVLSLEELYPTSSEKADSFHDGAT